MKLTSENVNLIFEACRHHADTSSTDVITVQGVKINVTFSRERISENKPAIEQMLLQLPDSFKETGGGGMSFLNMCDDSSGEQWTGLHSIMDELVCLGLAIDLICFPMPKELWTVLPGGMPYITILKSVNQSLK